MVHDCGRWHILLEPSVSTKKESEAIRSWVATVRMVTGIGEDITTSKQCDLKNKSASYAEEQSHFATFPVTLMKRVWPPRDARGF